MRWPWQRSAPSLSVAARRNRVVENDNPPDPILAFARVYAVASGARTRWTGDVLQVTRPDGKSSTYTTSAGGALGETELLVPGSEALAGMLADVESRTRLISLRLPPTADPEPLVRAALAVAPKDCGRCLSGDVQPNVAPCDACPLQTDRAGFVVSALPRRGSLRITRDEMPSSVELTYRVTARDRGGLVDDVVRLAFDVAGQRVKALSHEQVDAAVAMPLPNGASAMAAAARQRAEELLRPSLAAAGTLLRLRSADSYRERLEHLTATHDRLCREQPEDEQLVLASLQREVAALAEGYAVAVQATLESICFVASPVSHVSWCLAHGAELVFTLDTGRGVVTSVCSSCGNPTEQGIICQRGHLTCAECAPACGSCRGVSRAAGESSRHEMSVKGTAHALTTDDLTSLPRNTPRLWSQCAAWLLRCAGYDVHPTLSVADVWHATRDDRPVVVEVLAVGSTLTAAGVRRISKRAVREGALGLVVALRPTPVEVQTLAHELGVALLDKPALDALLSELTTKETRASPLTRGEAKERAAAAIKTRTAILDALNDAAGALSARPTVERVAGSAALTAALAELEAIQRSASQAFLAWETLVADWLSIFPERVTPDGGLVIDAGKDRLRELHDRAGHLGKVLAQVFERLNRTPTQGELGYDAWRAAMHEEYAAQCFALRARISCVDPNQWEDARHARNPEAEAAAERAIQDARHAAARTAKAYAHVAHLIARS